MDTYQFRDALESFKLRAQGILEEQPTPTWTQTPKEIATKIANDFAMDADFIYADLWLAIVDVIEKERAVTEYYMNQMGRWVAECNSSPSFHSGKD